MIHVFYCTNVMHDRANFNNENTIGAIETYKHVTSIDIASYGGADLERTWELMNIVDGHEIPCAIHARSMMTGDVVLRKCGQGYDAYGCASVGWKRLTPSSAMQLADKLDVGAVTFDENGKPLGALKGVAARKANAR